MNTTMIAAVLSFVVTAVLGKFLIPFLTKLKYGQTIREDGPTWHKVKEGTPTMGGLMFIAGITLSCIVGAILFYVSIGTAVSAHEIARQTAGIIMALMFGLVGFIDDYIKVVKKRNLGLTAKAKIVFQTLITASYLATIYLTGGVNTTFKIPFMAEIDLGIFYYVFCFIFIIFMVNAVNLTDGLDGLASSVTFVSAISYILIAGITGYALTRTYAAALAGGVLGFLIYNFYPAKVFMGDTGSMFLGGMVIMLAFSLNNPLILFLTGTLYIIEAMSVVLQVISFKLFKKRIFLMSPIHHHFEKKGMKEVPIVIMFTVVAAVFGAFAVLSQITF